MSKQRKIHLFNCDHTYKLDAVENWMNTAKSKPGFELTTKVHYFSLSQITEWSNKTIPELDMDVAVFVVHAHESRLSINEENAGIGYAKIYRALLQKTDGKVIIVVGGDDSYKDKDEEDRQWISRWARRKISSQFSEEFMDGRKSFIFSWDKKHREIHEKALQHFFDSSKKGEKFEYQPPKRQLPPRTTTPPPVRPSKQEASLRLYSTLPEMPYVGKRAQSTKPVVPVERRAHRIRDLGARPKEPRSSSTETKDLAVLGCSVSERSIYAVMQQIEHIRPKLNLHATPTVKNLFPAEVKEYLETNRLKFCVLVVDAKTVKGAYENLPKQRDEYEELLKTAVDRVAEKVIILVCDSLSLPREDESLIHQTIYRIVQEKDKGFIAWLKNGMLTVEPDVLAQFLLSSKPTVGHMIPPTSRPEGAQDQSNVTSFSDTKAYQTYVNQPRGHVVQSSEWETTHGFEKGNMQQPQDVIQQSYPPANTTYTGDNPSTGKAVFKSKLRNGRISYKEGDVELYSSEFQGIADETAQNLLKTFGHAPEIQVKIMSDPKDNTRVRVLVGDFASLYKDEGIQIADSETLMLKTRVRKGLVSLHEDDVEFQCPGWTVPVHILEDLKREASDGKLFIFSDDKGNLKCKVQSTGLIDKAAAAKNSVFVFFSSKIKSIKKKIV